MRRIYEFSGNLYTVYFNGVPDTTPYKTTIRTFDGTTWSNALAVSNSTTLPYHTPLIVNDVLYFESAPFFIVAANPSTGSPAVYRTTNGSTWTLPAMTGISSGETCNIIGGAFV